MEGDCVKSYCIDNTTPLGERIAATTALKRDIAGTKSGWQRDVELIEPGCGGHRKNGITVVPLITS